ncbi:MAG TPA: carboxypeptidase regulatory-like domain-containing protein [Bryobacteraceae bacterium]|nr:carboxypeptidase regulatory-like domain-containing protein [Bryobacteraceae bacterium]
MGITISHLQRRIERLLIASFVLALLLATIAPAGCAQEVTAAITGMVTDPSGAPVASATVIAKDADRGTVWRTETSPDGVYNLPRLPVGNYEVRVEATGFQTVVRPTFNLVLNQTARVDFQLTIGQVASTIEVTGAAPLLQTEATHVGTVMQSRAIANLPLETRNYNQLTLLTPGAVTISPASFNNGQKTFNAARPNLNGNREQANYYVLDGLDNNEFVDNNVAYSPNVDAIQEFNVITNNPSAEFGHFLGGVINVSLKSGTNQFHGNLFEYLRNDFFNANEWANNFNSLPTPRQRWNEYGGTVGGPIKKDKLFFFADYQGSRFDLPASPQQRTTFTAADVTGNLTDLGVALHYPGTNVVMPSDLTKATICGSGQKMGVNPCITGLSPTALTIASTLPAPNLPGTPGSNGTRANLINQQQTYTHGNQGDIKVDWAPTDRDRLFARYSQQHIEQPILNSEVFQYNSNGDNIFPLQQAVLDYTRTVTPTLVNDFRMGVNYFPAEANIQSLTTKAGANLIPGQPTPFLPGLFFAGAPLGGQQNGPFAFGTVNGPEVFHQTAIQVSDTAVFTKNAHTLRFGFQFIRYRNNYIPAVSSDGAAGQIGFTGTYTGNTEADFFLGLPAYMGYGMGFAGTVGQRNNAVGAFVQDDWRISSHLTVNVGMRWQLFTPIYEVHDRLTNFGMYSGQIQLAGQDGNSRALYNQYNGIANFLPRLGLAYSLNDKTVIRAAFSRSSFQEGTGEFNRLATNAPWNVALSGQWGGVGVNGAIPANQITLDQGFAALGAAGPPCTTQNVTSAPASCFAGVRIHATDPNYRPAVSNQWNFTVQRQVGNSFTAQAAYVGQHSDHLAAIYNMGQNVLLPDGSAVPGPYLTGNPSLVANNTGAQRRLNTSTAIQNYNALQLTAQERLSKGLAFAFNYSFAKCLTNNQGYYGRYGNAAAAQTTADVAFQMYVYNVGLDYGLCDADVTNTFTGYLNYDLPFGRDRRFGRNMNKALNAIAGGWRYDTIVSAHGGFPISMIQFGNDPTGAYFQPRPDCIAPSKATPYKNFAGGGYVWFDPTTMRIPGPGDLGTCGISSERGPGLKQIDMSLSKTFAITERQSLQFRFDAINTFNTPIFTVLGYATDVLPGDWNQNVGRYGSDAAYTASVPTGVVNTSQGARNLQFALKYTF